MSSLPDVGGHGVCAECGERVQEYKGTDTSDEKHSEGNASDTAGGV